jgi:HlyD family secretion protein
MTHDPEIKPPPWLVKHLGWKPMAIVVIATAIATAIPLYVVLQARFNDNGGLAAEPAQIDSPIRTVNALGRLEPVGGVTRLAASLPSEGARVMELRVKAGDNVTAGQIIAVLDSHPRLEASLEQVRRNVDVAQANLVRVQSAAEVGEIEAQQAQIRQLEAELTGEVQLQTAAIARLDAELSTATAEYERHQQLYTAGAVSKSLLDSMRLPVATLQQQIAETNATLNRNVNALQERIASARAELSQLEQVLPADVEMARTELASAIAAVQRAEAELEMAYVRAPIDGQVLTLHTLPGEIIKPEGIVELGQIQQMYAIAEVYETDVSLLRVGQPATIVSENGGFSGDLHGTVEDIGRQIGQRDVQETDPAARVDVRVVEVKIRLDEADSQRVAALTNLRVKVTIKI